MSRSEKKRARRLRWRLMQSLTVTFVLLWLGTMVLFTSNTCSDMESGAKTAARAAQTSVDEHYEFYTNNIASGLGEQANHILSGNLSSLSLGQVSEMDGGMAFVVRTLSVGCIPWDKAIAATLRAATRGTAFTILAVMTRSMSLRPLSTCSLTSPFSRKGGRSITMWPAAGHPPSPCWRCCGSFPSSGRCPSAWTMTLLVMPPVSAWQRF